VPSAQSVRSYQDLQVWQKADELVHLIYDLTNNFPKSELYNLTDQLKRASLSVPTNIVEGFYRYSKKEQHKFLLIALASLKETDYLALFAHKRGCLTEQEFRQIQAIVIQLEPMLKSFIFKLK